MTLTDTAGKVVLSSQLTLDTLVPQTTIAYPVQADPPTTPGTYQVRATLDFGGSAPTVFEGPVIVTARPTATPAPAAPAGRTRPTQATAPNAPNASVTANAPTKSGGISSTTVILGGVIGLLLITVASLTLVVLRSKQRKPKA